MKKNYWCVKSEFYEDGTVKAVIIGRMHEEKPSSTCRRCLGMTAYNDWFDTFEEAKAFLAEARAA